MSSRPRNAPSQPPPREHLERVYGLNAVLAVFRKRPDDIVRIAHTAAVRHEVAPLLKAAAARRVRYNEVPDEDLDRIADGTHHEGVCVFTRPRAWLSVDALVARMRSDRALTVVALDRVTNPHNFGAVLRSAAYLGVGAVLVRSDEGASNLGPSAARIAEGGAEEIALAHARSMPDALRALADAGALVVGTDAKGAHDVHAFRWRSPCVLVLGSERYGLSPDVRGLCHTMVRVPGTGVIDSLNVSVAAGILMASMTHAVTSRAR